MIAPTISIEIWVDSLRVISKCKSLFYAIEYVLIFPWISNQMILSRVWLTR